MTAVSISNRAPSIVGGEPAFPDGLPLMRPTLPDLAKLERNLGTILESGILTNGPTVENARGARG